MSTFPEPVDSLSVIMSKPCVWDRIRAYGVLLETLFKRRYPTETFRWSDEGLAELISGDQRFMKDYSTFTTKEGRIIKKVRNYATAVSNLNRNRGLKNEPRKLV